MKLFHSIHTKCHKPTLGKLCGVKEEHQTSKRVNFFPVLVFLMIHLSLLLLLKASLGVFIYLLFHAEMNERKAHTDYSVCKL